MKARRLTVELNEILNRFIKAYDKSKKTKNKPELWVLRDIAVGEIKESFLRKPLISIARDCDFEEV